MGNEGSARAECIFCGATDKKMSKEHVWPEWLDKLLPPGVAEADHTYSFEDAERGEYLRLTEMPPHDVKVRDVCEPCNNGWMNDAERAAKPIISRLVGATYEFELHAIEQAKLAFWGVMKGLVAVRVGGGGSLARPLAEDYRAVYECRGSRMPPDGFLVHIARAAWSLKQAPAGYFRLSGINRQGREGNEFDGYALIFSALDLVVMVVRVFGVKPTGFVPLDDQRYADAIRRVWAVEPRGISWPPEKALTWEGLEVFSGGRMKP